MNSNTVKQVKKKNEGTSLVKEHTSKQAISESKSLVFMFPCLGNHYLNMGKKHYETEKIFHEQVDRLCLLAEPLLNVNLKRLLYTESKKESEGKDNFMQKMLRKGKNEKNELDRILFGHPAVFITEYAFAMLLIDKGIKPDAMIGQSIGEYTAACIAGVMSPEDTLTIIIERAGMIQELTEGCMTITLLSEEDIAPMLGDRLSISVIASPYTCTVGGATDAVADFEKRLQEKGVFCTRFGGSTHAIHTKMMEPIKDEFITLMKTIKLTAPVIPYISNVTGTWITDKQAADPEYWFEHTCRTVRFADGIEELMKNRGSVFLEVGPGHVLSSYARQHPAAESFSGNFVFQTMPADNDIQKETTFLSNTFEALKATMPNLKF